ncbi:MAG TPA: HAMP domain-containing protein, partial [Steroidobacteraceae bacterium]|nr:HAMP domain-containing protein [Steroidobacteraceae bacterium]
MAHAPSSTGTRKAAGTQAGLLGRLTIGHQFGIVITGLMLPVALLFLENLRAGWLEISFAQREAEGVAHITHIDDLLQPIVDHGYAATRRELGASSAAKSQAEAATRADAAMTELQQHVASSGDPLGLDGEIGAVQAAWQQVRDRPLQDDPDAVVATHLALADRISGLVASIADHSGLQLDPDVRTYYFKDTLVNQFPVVLDRLTHVTLMASHLAAQPPEQRLRDSMIAITDALDEQVANLQENREHMLETAPDHADAVAGGLTDIGTSSRALTVALRQFADMGGDPAEVRALARKAMADAIAGFDQVIVAAEAGYADRAAERKRQLLLSTLLNGAVTVAAMLLAAYVRRRIVRSLERAVEVSTAIGDGKLDNEIETTDRDEAAQLLRAMGETQRRLRESIEAEHARVETERRLAAANARIKQALDAVSAPALLADTDYNIIYLNHAMRALFADIRDDLRRVLPHFDPTTLEGASMDVFHRNASHQRQLLDGLTAAHTADHQIGVLSLRLTHTPVFDEHGRRIGTAMEWINRTQEVAAEKEVASIVEEALGGDLSHRVRTEGKTGFFANLAAGMNALLDNFGDVIQALKTSAGEVRDSAEEISKGNTSLSQRTEEQASSLEETASSMEEMTSTVKQTADNAMQANQLAMAARTQAEKGGAVVGRAVSAMSGINAASRKIA